jgi:hypothetical protein
MTKGNMHTLFYPEIMKRVDNLDDQGVDGRILLKLILNSTWMRGVDSASSGRGQVAGYCYHGYETLCSVKTENLSAT